MTDRCPIARAARSPSPTDAATLASTIGGLDQILIAREEWNRLAVQAGSPFLTPDWLLAWWRAFGEGEPACLLVRNTGGELRAAAFCRRTRGVLASLTNDESGDWDVVALDDTARRQAWAELAAVGALRLRLERLPQSALAPATSVLRAAGYRVTASPGPCSPWRPLPPSWEDLMASVSRNARSQFGRRRRALEREGELTLRVDISGRDLDAVLALEASGWKHHESTAITSDARSERLYREFAAAAAAKGWLRLYLLELDGVPIAADYGCVLGNAGFLLKTGFDERYGRLSPGLILRGEVLRASIEEGLGRYDFLGGPDPYKLRWGASVLPRATIWGYRGLAAPGHLWRSRLRARLKRLRDRGGSVGGERCTVDDQQPELRPM